MKRRSVPDGFYHLARDTAEADKQTRIKNRRPKSFASTAPQYFVPGFSVRRRVLITPEVRQFVKDLEENLPRNYRVFDARSLAMTIIEQRRLVERFRRADAHPAPAAMQVVAERTAAELKQSLRGVPRKLVLPTGVIDSFGEKGSRDKLGIVPRGWRGYRANYAERDANKLILPMPIILRETNICIGGLATAFGRGDDEELGHGLRVEGISRTPHITFAQKEKGGPISHSETAAMEGMISEFMPEELNLFDPIIYLRLAQKQHEPIEITARSQRLREHAPYLTGVAA